METHDTPSSIKAGPQIAVATDASPPGRGQSGAGASAWWRTLGLVLAVAITGLIFAYRDNLAQFSSYGYLGLLIVSIVGNATVLLPVPSLAATFVSGGIFDPFVVGLVSGLGMAIGELSGYLAGYGGSAIVEARDEERHQRLQAWMRRHGMVTVFVLSLIPNPIFDLAGIAAGMLHLPIWRFLLACFLGKVLKGWLFAFAGSRSLVWVERFLH